MTEENNSLDIQGAQDYLNDLLEAQQPAVINKDDEKEDNLSPKEAELLRNLANIDDIEEKLDPKQIKKLIEFVGGDWKNRVPEELSDEELERLTRIVIVKAGHFNYKPKKKFDASYKKERQRKNKQAKASRMVNRR